MKRLDGSIPAFLTFDAEPDNLDMQDGVAGWDGYAAFADLAETLRGPLETATGTAPTLGWYFRMDLQMEAVYGRADYAVTAFPEMFQRLQRAGDVFGIHVHPIRWDESAGRWFHEHADTEWIAQCLDAAFDAYRGAFGHMPERHRFGNAFMTNEIAHQLERHGVKVDLTVEPGTQSSWWDGALPPNAATPDMVDAPTHPYRPATDDFCREDPARPGELLMVPLSCAASRFDKPVWWRALRSVRHCFRPLSLPLNPWREWPSPTAYWDLVAGQLGSMRDPYLALAIRTDHPDSEPAGRSMDILRALPSHPVAERLRFTDPVSTLCTPPPGPRQGLAPS
jgi:hypothetical protein